MDKSRSDYYKRLIPGIIISLIAPLLIVLISLRVWETDFTLQISYGGDGTLCQLLIKSISDNGIMGMWLNYDLGAPQLSALADSPFIDLLMGLEIYVLTRFIKSSVAVLYVIYIISYPMISLFMYILVTRKLSDHQIINSIMAVAYSIAPYHFMRGMGHVTLSRYFLVPISIYITITIIENAYEKGKPVSYSCKKALILYGLCIMLGMGNIYYAFGGLICIFVGILIKLLRTKTFRVLLNEALAIPFVLLGVFIGLFPKIYFTLKYGENIYVASRVPMATEVYALKIIQLLLPCSYNRVSYLRRIFENYTSNAFNVNENTMSSLGFFATIGFICACGIMIGKFVFTNDKNDTRSDRLNYFSFLILTFILYSVGGGIGTLVSYYITPEIRCVNRFCIIISCLSLCILNILLASLYDLTNYKKVISAILSVSIAFVLYSEVYIPVKGYQIGSAEQTKILNTFFDKVQSSLEKDSMVYQLPYLEFPEAIPTGNMIDYEPALAYIMTDDLKWSYGAMKGRDTAAADLYIDDGMSYDFVQGIIDSGFKAVLIDTKGYDDGGKDIIDFYSSQLGLEPIMSEDGWFYFYILN